MKNVDFKLGLKISSVLSLIVVSFRMMREDDMQWNIAIVTCIFNFFYGLTCWYIHASLLARREQLDDDNWLYPFWSILCTALLIFIFDYIFSLLPYDAIQFPESSGLKKYFNIAFRGILISSFYYFIVYHLYIQKQKQQHSLEIEHLRQARLEANLSSLKEQLSPHFLFNTLNTLSSISQEEYVKEYVDELASVYRYLLKHNKMDTVSWREELEFIESYLYIIKTRMEDAIDVQVRISEEKMDNLIPPLTLQILIENAIKHNVASTSKPLKIIISDHEENLLIISNNFQPKKFTQTSTGIGLKNIQLRYQLLFKASILLEKSDADFTVKLPVVTL